VWCGCFTIKAGAIGGGEKPAISKAVRFENLTY